MTCNIYMLLYIRSFGSDSFALLTPSILVPTDVAYSEEFSVVNLPLICGIRRNFLVV